MLQESREVADAVARVCTEEPGIRARLDRAGDTGPLDRLIAAVRDGDLVSERLDELHAALQQCGDALGVYGATRRGGYRSAVPVGMGNPRAVEVLFLCPRGTCSRTWRPDPSTPSSTPPTCQLHDGERLRWTRLP
ncbi:MAG: hypothetical protein ACR2GH_15910 [Pseudonocardia sp.]